jgi:uncharacterized protein (TIGR02246 family)
MRWMALVVLAVCTVPVAAQDKDQLFTATRQQLDVTKVLLAQESAWNAGDLDGYVSHYKDAPDTQAILGSAAHGLDTIRNAFRQNFPNREVMGHLENSEVEVRALGDNFTLVTGRYQLTRSKKGGGDATGTFTEIFEKTTAGWQVIFSENT